jgi:hypothetical protein
LQVFEGKRFLPGQVRTLLQGSIGRFVRILQSL